MADYSITFARSARKELEAISNPLISRIILKIEALCETPRHPVAENLQAAMICGESASATIELSIR